RYYDPATGRFLSEDPARFVGGINSYAYVYNDPVDLVDPMGLVAGPKEPRAPTHCYEEDSCSTLLGKMQLLQKTIKSHSGWDRHVPAPRGGGRHAEEIANYWRAYARCQQIWLSKCANLKCPEELRLEEEAARRMESFWKTILYGLPAIPLGYSLPVLAPVLAPFAPEIPAFAF
ncbi:MAG TPA: RHS repeat-associated core domain-containing protein, partial [Terriglobia bacterium]|nr:RHS repeat-associated core domain-containing protein [Terriglobia bacterium]